MVKELVAEDHIRNLLLAGEPVSFYDALMILRELGRREPSSAELGALLRLEGDPRTTDGAREILTEYLRNLAARHARERTLGSAAITLEASGRRVRAPVGGTLHLELDERRGAGFRWELSRQQGPLQCRRQPNESGGTRQASFEVTLLREGKGSLQLQEKPPPADTGTQSSRFFELEIVIEPAL